MVPAALELAAGLPPAGALARGCSGRATDAPVLGARAVAVTAGGEDESARQEQGQKT